MQIKLFTERKNVGITNVSSEQKKYRNLHQNTILNYEGTTTDNKHLWEKQIVAESCNRELEYKIKMAIFGKMKPYENDQIIRYSRISSLVYFY